MTWAEETYHRFGGEPACLLQTLSVSASGRFVANSPVGFPGLQVADAQFRQILLVALINLLHGQIRVIHLVLPRCHILGVIRRGSDHRTSLSNAHAEFPRGGLIICIAEAMPDAGTLDSMADERIS